MASYEQVSASHGNPDRDSAGDIASHHDNHHGHHGHSHVDMDEDWKTLDNSAAFVLKHVKSGTKVLDAGCSAGALTVQFAQRFPDTNFVGIDVDEASIERAQSSYSGQQNLTFEGGNLTKLPFKTDSFDVVYSFQVLHHVDNPSLAFAEMKRVCAPGGVVAIRENNWSCSWYPQNEALDSWSPLMGRALKKMGGHPDLVYELPKLARDAGFEKIDSSASTWCFSTPQERKWWADRWCDCFEKGHMAEKLRENGVSSEEMTSIAAAMRAWAEEEYGWCIVTFGEVICHA